MICGGSCRGLTGLLIGRFEAGDEWCTLFHVLFELWCVCVCVGVCVCVCVCELCRARKACCY
jgi:hypothetical protein